MRFTLSEWKKYISKHQITVNEVQAVLNDWQEDRKNLLHEFELLLQKKQITNVTYIGKITK
jgi:Fe-S cluster biosynthesis and repair protein YggX